MPYIWDEVDSVFYPLHGLDTEVPVSAFHGLASGIGEAEQRRRRRLFGANAILVPVIPIPLLIVKEILNPFYVFQVIDDNLTDLIYLRKVSFYELLLPQIFSVTLWFADEYIAYAIAIVIMSVVGIAASVYQLKKVQMKRLTRNT